MNLASLNFKNDPQNDGNISWQMLDHLNPATYMAHANYEVISLHKISATACRRGPVDSAPFCLRCVNHQLKLHSSFHIHICNMFLSVHHNFAIQFHLFSITKINMTNIVIFCHVVHRFAFEQSSQASTICSMETNTIFLNPLDLLM
jgi:hypothetical protein